MGDPPQPLATLLVDTPARSWHCGAISDAIIALYALHLPNGPSVFKVHGEVYRFIAHAQCSCVAVWTCYACIPLLYMRTHYITFVHALWSRTSSVFLPTVVFGNTDRVLLLSRNALSPTDAGVVPLDDLCLADIMLRSKCNDKLCEIINKENWNKQEAHGMWLSGYVGNCPGRGMSRDTTGTNVQIPVQDHKCGGYDLGQPD